MALAVAQSFSATSSSASSETVSVSGVTSGNALLVAAVARSSVGTTITGIADNKSNSYSKLDDDTFQNSNDNYVGLWLATNINASGLTGVTASASASTIIRVVIWELSGGVPALDGTVNWVYSGAATSQASGSLTPSSAGLAFSFANRSNTSVALSPSAGWTKDQDTGAESVGASRTTTSGSAVSCTWSWSTSSQVKIATFLLKLNTGTLSGTLTDSISGSALSGVSLTLDSVGQGTQSSPYSLQASAGSHTLAVSLTGYNGRSVSVSVTSGSTTTQNFSLPPNALTKAASSASSSKLSRQLGLLRQTLQSPTISLTKALSLTFFRPVQGSLAALQRTLSSSRSLSSSATAGLTRQLGFIKSSSSDSALTFATLIGHLYSYSYAVVSSGSLTLARALSRQEALGQSSLPALARRYQLARALSSASSTHLTRQLARPFAVASGSSARLQRGYSLLRAAVSASSPGFAASRLLRLSLSLASSSSAQLSRSLNLSYSGLSSWSARMPQALHNRLFQRHTWRAAVRLTRRYGGRLSK